MYEKHFGLREKPFSLLPDPDYLLLGSKHRMAYSLLEYGLSYSDGFTVITGEIGCGKTTLVQQLLRSTGPQITFAFISDTIRLQGEILERVLMAYGLESGAQNDKWTDKFKRFSDFAVDEYAKGRRLVVIIDEAQNMDTEALEELRVLSNINSGKNLLVQIILTGQPELRQKLSDPRLKQFAQRIGKLYHLMPLDRKETHEYIHHRITIAGGDPSLFTREAGEIIYASSGGVPRIINQLCDAALVYGYGMDKKKIDRHVIAPMISDQSHAWTVTPASSPPNPTELAFIHDTIVDSPLDSEAMSQTSRELALPSPNQTPLLDLDLSRLDSESQPQTAEYTEEENCDLNTQNSEDIYTETVIRGMHYVAADSSHRKRFGLPLSGSVSGIEWINIICENERARVKDAYTQYQNQGSNSSLTMTTTIEDIHNKRMLVNLEFELSDDGSKSWLNKGLGKQCLKLNIEDRLANISTSNGLSPNTQGSVLLQQT
jgi:type II secretory pathway predicted ATPase ExeA